MLSLQKIVRLKHFDVNDLNRSLMEMINKSAEEYVARFTSKEDNLLAEIAQYTTQSHPLSIMLSGHVQGKILEMLSCLINPKNVLEIGTFMGYSALCLAKGLQHNGKLHTIEVRDEDANSAQGFFSKSLNNNKIVLHRGDAHKIIPTLKMEWDIVFIDADKRS